MAHKTGSGSSKNGRDSISKRLGIKLNNNFKIKSGSIIIRQRGLCFLPGKNVNVGKDFTLYALCDGILKFSELKTINIFPIKGESEI